MRPPLQRYPLAIRIVLMFCMFMFNISIVSFLAMAVVPNLFSVQNVTAISEGTLNSLGDIHAFLFIQGVGSLGGFALTAMMFSVLESGEFKHYLRLKIYPSVKMILLTVLAIIISQFFLDFLVQLNQKIALPASLQLIYDYQKKAEDITNAVMNFKDFGTFIAVSFVMALIPAVAEEFFFRGLLLGDLLKGKVRPGIAIPLTGVLFAISHFEYDNTIAIFVLGSFLGYLYYVSGSLWLSIIAHFTNNFLAVIMKYLFSLGIISKDLADAKTPFYLTALSVVIFSVFIFLYNKWKNPANFVEVAESESFN